MSAACQMPGGAPVSGPLAPTVPISVVVLNWNNHADTRRCLDSLRAASPTVARVLVVDNASRDDSLRRIREWARDAAVTFAEIAPGEPLTARAEDGWLTLVRSPENRGFAGGNNVGMRALLALPDVAHIFLLNNDATVAPDYFCELWRAVEAAPHYGLLSGTTYYQAEPERVWYAGGVERPARALFQHCHVVPPGDGPYPTEFVCGCTMLISRRAAMTLGPLAEAYFPGYGEDCEYSRRARGAGLAVLYAPRARAYHKIGGTFGASDRTLYLFYRHRGYYVRRNMRGRERATALAYLLVTKPARALANLARGRGADAWAVLAGTAAGLLRRDALRESRWSDYAASGSEAGAGDIPGSKASSARRSEASSTERHASAP